MAPSKGQSNHQTTWGAASQQTENPCLLQSSDAKPVSKPATGSETARIPSKPPLVHPSTAPKAATTAPAPAPATSGAPAPGPVTTVALSTILEEQESQIETDADDEDLYMDHPSVSSNEDIFSGLEPLDVELPAPSDQSSKARVARKVGKGASKAAVALPHTIKFSIPSRFRLKQLIWRTHHVEPTTTIADLKETIHLILGLDAIPAVKHPPLVTHIKHNPAKLCFALDTDDDWEALKDEWRKRAAKRGEDTCIEIVTGPKFFDFLEEAVAAHAASSKGKAKARPSLPLTPFFRTTQPLSLSGTSGVDINTPPKIEYFKFFHTQDGSSAPASHHSRPKRGRSPSPSDRVASPDDNAPVDDLPTPTIGEWITHLEMQRLAYKRWDFLRQKFAKEESMDMLISSLARLSLANLKVGYSLKMVDAVFILEQLEVAGKWYGFAVGAEDDDRQRSKKARY
ncbi:hypothetical protein JB92DRAFT_3104311 [Gautieria morchelliformis]|nr:hypothetical protein JB92DRAFT_3104311 [Gautieria morchelliformis]